ncbi:anti-sigma factor [Reichenbachiella carrageenanivorans]|uniref:Regulator of SigK n=1 Tax=Reichenbachiella carrageenanivorans TaxID=2979869 RepID=A0ABY6CZX2_9BACT|nr:anti-sigma factor [Reichenbachiella carrageenanivorans]UXX79465.1 anti-sigma factor [Reichenbachiella carrageenanivorans]
MNIEEYIASGILELYVLDELPATERAEVEQMCEVHKEIRLELSLIENTMGTLALHTAVMPPPALKEKIKTQISASAPKAIEMPTVAPERPFNFAVAASVSVAILASALAFYFYSQWQSTQGQLEVLIAQNQEVADNYQFVNKRLQGLESDLDILSSPDYARIAMNGTENSPQSLATVYWNSHTAEVYLKIQNLKSLSEQQQYQLWAIVDGVPVDMGVFDTSTDLLQMKSVSAAAAFAVTIEPKGGSENPSLETMQVVGTTEV